jgi:hypothetical protein
MHEEYRARDSVEKKEGNELVRVERVLEGSRIKTCIGGSGAEIEWG